MNSIKELPTYTIVAIFKVSLKRVHAQKLI